MADQQFCLRWNNHQSTLISVFDSLLERGCLVDCTLAAEGRSLQAHKVVLSACSPYLEDLLSQHYDKHPILLLKDVKFEELQAMMDYMYRGEVNIAQDKLGTFLQAAESLQIKGLSDNGGKEPPDSGGTSSSTSKRTVKGVPVVRPATNLEPRKQVSQEILLDGSSQDGSLSPALKRRKRGRSLVDESEMNEKTGNAPESHAPPPAAAPATTPSAPNKESLPLVPTSEASDPNLGLLSTLMESSQTDNQDSNSSTRDGLMREKQEPTSEILIEPKTEYIDDDEQDLTLEDGMDNSMFRPGPSGHQSGYQLQGSNDSTDGVFMAAQEAGAQDAQGGVQTWLNFKEQLAGMQWPWSYHQVQLPPGVDIIPRSGSGPWPPGRPRGPGSVVGLSGQRPPRKDLYSCPQCGKVYTWKCSLSLHLRQECGKEPQFQCPHCPHRTKQKGNLEKHIFSKHSDMSYLQHTAPPRGPEQIEQAQPQPQQPQPQQPQPQQQPAGPQHQQS